MRTLTGAQKSLLTKVLKANEPTAEQKIYGNENSIKDYESLPVQVWDELVKMNDTEILYQQVNYFINDWRWAQLK